MAELSLPDSPPGNLRLLLLELHDLHAKAGWPSTREIARNMRFSHTTVHDLLTKSHDTAPKLPLLLDVVERLAADVRRLDVDGTLDKFDRMWRAAYERPFSDHAVNHTAVEASGHERIRVTFIHPSNPSGTLVATVGVDLPAGLLLERLIEANFVPSAVGRPAYRLVEASSGKAFANDETLRMAGIRDGTTIYVEWTVTAG